MELTLKKTVTEETKVTIEFPFYMKFYDSTFFKFIDKDRCIEIEAFVGLNSYRINFSTNTPIMLNTYFGDKQSTPISEQEFNEAYADVLNRLSNILTNEPKPTLQHA